MMIVGVEFNLEVLRIRSFYITRHSASSIGPPDESVDRYDACDSSDTWRSNSTCVHESRTAVGRENCTLVPAGCVQRYLLGRSARCCAKVAGPVVAPLVRPVFSNCTNTKHVLRGRPQPVHDTRFTVLQRDSVKQLVVTSGGACVLDLVPGRTPKMS